MELYSKDKVFFVAPLSKQFDFYAKEAIPEYEPSTTEEEEEEDDYIYYNEIHSKHYQKRQAYENCSYCDPLLHSSSCEKCKRAL